MSYIERAQGDGQVLRDDALWLHEYHLRMGESAQQRALGMLAFGGVLVALTPAAIPGCLLVGQWALLAGSLTLVVVGIALSGVVMMPSEARMIEVPELRSRLNELANRDDSALLGRQVFQSTHALIYTDDPHPDSPKFRDLSVIGTERRLTQRRMRLLSLSAWFLLAGVAVLAALLLWVAADTIRP